MIKVALTGSIGSGKSTAAKAFAYLGVPIFNADDRAKELYKLPEIKRKLVDYFGNSILDENHQLIRKELATIVFANKEKLQWLNELIHPMVKSQLDAWMLENEDKPYIIQEAAILFETGFDKYFDKIITVSTSIEERIQRVILRDSVEREAVLDRIKHQICDEEKEKRSDFVLKNEDRILLFEQVLSVHTKIMNLSKTLLV